MSQIDARLSDAEKRLVPTQIAANSISGTLLQTNSVDSNTLADNAVTNRHIESGAVDTSQLADNSVNADKLADSSVNVATTVVTGTLPVTKGGIGLTTLSTGALYASAPGTTVSNGTLPVGAGGTGATTFTSGDYLKGAGTAAITSQTGIPAGDITSGTIAVARFPTGAPTLYQGGTSTGSSGVVTITFATSFSATPAVTVTPYVTSRTYRIDSISSTSFTVQDSPASGAAVSVTWTAVGRA